MLLTPGISPWPPWRRCAALPALGAGRRDRARRCHDRRETSIRPIREADYPNQVFFGDTHLHTSYSTDAGMVGNRLEARRGLSLRQGRGGDVVAPACRPGWSARSTSSWSPIMPRTSGSRRCSAEADAELLATEWGKRVYDLYASGDGWGAYEQWCLAIGASEDPLPDPELVQTVWSRLIDSGRASHDQPGVFTALTASSGPRPMTARTCTARSSSATARTTRRSIIPISQYDTYNPEELWLWMADYEADTGGRVLAIPHNGNLSNGLMFDDGNLRPSAPIDREYAETPAALGAALRGDADQGRRRGAPDAVAQRRVRRLLHLGQGRLRRSRRRRPTCCRGNTHGRR